VAVVTPVYNGAAFLQETIDSVQAQTYPNLVHIILDNASSDATAEIIERNLGRGVRIRAFRNEALLPLCDNWNKAMSLAAEEAEYLRLLCADDLMSPEFIERAVAVAQSDKDIVVVASKIDWAHEPLEMNWPSAASMDGVDAIRSYLSGEIGLFAIHCLIRKSALRSDRPIFDETLKTGMDYEGVLALLHGGRLGFIHDALGWVRIHENTVTSQVMYRENIHFRDWLTVLHRYGPRVMSPRQFRDIAGKYERHYVRRIMRWRFQRGRSAQAMAHLHHLKTVRGSLSPAFLFLAYAEAILLRLGLAQGWRAWPR
jgi:glycosyltransferase involved in cell wall biosynthesis